VLEEIFRKAQDPIGILGIIGQTVFATRFMLQWIASEKKGESTIPQAFWWCSIVGGSMTLTYGFLRAELPIIMGQLFANLVYVRNLVLIYRKKRIDEADIGTDDDPLLAED
jgi:lipid-A-disaccharide synthase-like uncharacterized protein